jgi:hypothetical protein
MTAELLTEHFAIQKKDADRALEAFADNDLMTARVEGDARSLQRPEFNTMLVVESTEEVEAPTGDTRKKFAEMAGDKLVEHDIEWLGAI